MDVARDVELRRRPGRCRRRLIPAGKTVSVAADDTQNAGRLTLRGTLALGDQAELDADGLAAGGGTVSGPQYAMLVVTTDTGHTGHGRELGLTVDGAYLNVTGDGTFAVAGPLSLNNGGWVESDVDAIWTGSAPWRIGGAAGSPPSASRSSARSSRSPARPQRSPRAQATA